MHDVRRVSDDRKARPHIASRKMRFERPRLARPLETDLAELAAETLVDLGQETRIVQRQDALRLLLSLAPGNATAVALERQDGERPARQEVLHGAAVVRALMCHGGDDAGLFEAPADQL